MLKTSDFDFNLPSNLIAQKPFFPKEETKMLICNQDGISDAQVMNLAGFLQKGDVLVFNNARVIKAKLSATIQRNSAHLDFNLDQNLNCDKSNENAIWNALCKPAKKVQTGDHLQIAPDFFATVLNKSDDGFITIEFDSCGNALLEKFEKYGEVPLPPYIKRSDETTAELTKDDRTNYQTIYASGGTAVAAPTAGLHINEKIMASLEERGIQKAFVTLNVGAGTFLPVRSDHIQDHKMHSEFFTISQESADIINAAKKAGNRVVAVGTTSLRVLESSCDDNGIMQATQTNTKIFIYPPYKFKITDILMTNFHLPKSTLFMLICAFIGKEGAFKVYNHAIDNKYRFYSYGDSSLLFKNDV